MLRFISCQQTTLLIEQRAAAPLSAEDRNSLWLHLRYCPYCRRYEKQSAVLDQLARTAIRRRVGAADGLPDEARQRLAQRLASALPGAGETS